MSEELQIHDAEVDTWTRIVFCRSFFQPVLYLGLVLLPFDHGAAKTDREFRLILQEGWVSVLLISLLTPVCLIALSEQKWAEKIGQILFALFAWFVVQFCAILAIGIWSISQHGLSLS